VFLALIGKGHLVSSFCLNFTEDKKKRNILLLHREKCVSLHMCIHVSLCMFFYCWCCYVAVDIHRVDKWRLHRWQAQTRCHCRLSVQVFTSCYSLSGVPCIHQEIWGFVCFFHRLHCHVLVPSTGYSVASEHSVVADRDNHWRFVNVLKWYFTSPVAFQLQTYFVTN